MDRGIALLSAREREVLRLLGRGHDAKSTARALDVSIHTVNERLRDARRKLEVSSSREAARRLLAAEGEPEQISGDKEIGFVTPTDMVARAVAPAMHAGTNRFLVAGAFLMVLTALIAVGAYAVGQHAAEGQTTGPKVTATTPASGTAIAPGPFLLSVTFDQPMQDQSFSFVLIPSQTPPRDCEWPARLSPDRRTYSVRCVADPGVHYGFWLNREPYMNFRSERGVAAQPYQLLFEARQH